MKSSSWAFNGVRPSGSASTTRWTPDDPDQATGRSYGPPQAARPRQACRFFERGQCRDGPNCKFSHEIVPLRAAATEDGAGQSVQKEVCRFFERGHCRDGPLCRFSHEIETPLRAIDDAHQTNVSGAQQPAPKRPCHFFERGLCRDGPACRFSHEIETPLVSQHGQQAQTTGREHGVQQLTQKEMCKYFERGNCRDGPDCRFSHDVEQPFGKQNGLQATGSESKQSTKKPLCRFFQLGHCRDGPTCRFSHEIAQRGGLEQDMSHVIAGDHISGTLHQSRLSENLGCSESGPNTRSSSEDIKARNSSSLSLQRLGQQPPTKALLFRTSEELHDWLTNQVAMFAGDNIEQLSGEKGLHVLSTIVEQRNLPDETITLFVKLLVKDDIRSSLLREKTNKIYGILLGSPFLLQLHAHIAGQFGIIAPKPQDVKPYVLLIEELQSRTTNGWKEVPLDATQSVVSRLGKSPAKVELLEIVTRLIDQREKLHRALALASSPRGKSSLGPAKFRQTEIVPGKDELLGLQARQDLPVNLVGRQYSSVSHYVGTHFHLLREDCIEPLRQGIRAYRSKRYQTDSSLNSTPDLRIFSEVRLIGIRCGDSGVDYVLSFHLPQNAATQWETSKRLMLGSLVCISSDAFETFFWGVVARRDIKDLAKDQVEIRIVGESGSNVTAELQSGRSAVELYVMVESATAYFDAYYHVLKSLQREEMEEIPFPQYLLHLESKVSPPSYLLRRKSGDEFDFSSTFPEIRKRLGRSDIRILHDWPDGWAGSELDTAQQNALKHSLTKELAIIQGPPGTGKTFLGLLVVKILLSNLKKTPCGMTLAPEELSLLRRLGDQQQVEYDMSGPLLVVCYTNHALDQFLEGIYKTEPNLIRIGGRGKSEALKERNLQTLVLQQRIENKVDGSHRRLYAEGRSDKDALEKSISQCIETMWTRLVTRDLLQGVASSEQIESLFWRSRLDPSAQHLVEIWLNEGWCRDRRSALSFMRDQSLFSIHSRSLDCSEEFAKPLRGQLKFLPNFERNGNTAAMANEQGALLRIGPLDREPPLQDFIDRPNVWHLNLSQRRKLHDYWLEEIRMNSRKTLRELSQQYEAACKSVIQVENEIQASLLRNAKVVGMTTTAAAKHIDILRSLKSEVVIVEEAAEVLEGHILACLSLSVKHLILIGDHLQLRPKVAVPLLANKHHLDVSMFERLVRSGVEHVTLQEQRRMRPTISKLVKPLYPDLKDHESVAKYEQVPGVVSNVFFFDHKAEEGSNNDSASKVNPVEAKLVVELCLYLLNQGCYSASNIAILTTYTGQLLELKKLLRQRVSCRFWVRPLGQSDEEPDVQEGDFLPRVCSVDDFQGEESDIIILSLVRSNSITTNEGVGKIGFLKNPNRVCVALSRARKGFFIFGNADLLAESSSLWKDVITGMRADGMLDLHLELYCTKHPDSKTKITLVEDFKQVEDGGCSRACDYQLECGHACPRRCHPWSHDLVVCAKPCLRLHDDCEHQCRLRCHGTEECPPCEVMVLKSLLQCDHIQYMKCSGNLIDEVCRSTCPKVLRCGHECKNLCGRPCTESCEKLVLKTLPCGHSAQVACHVAPESHICEEPCETILSDCEHPCTGSCGKCKQGSAHIPCQSKCSRILPCSHSCEAGCSTNCPPCGKVCHKRCLHSRCSLECGEICRPCRESCAWSCDHEKCEKLCHEICTRPRCDRHCSKLLPQCGHPCIGLCGEPCPTICRTCHSETRDAITLMTLGEYEDSDCFVQLEDCGHLFEVTGLDTWMDANEPAQRSDGSVAIKLKECPECRSPIWQTHRYSNVVKLKQAQVEEVKKQICGRSNTRQGNFLLEQGDLVGARSSFEQALLQNPGLMEAHFGIGYTYFKLEAYDEAMTHLCFVVERSSFASELGAVIGKTRGRFALEDVFSRSSGRASNGITKMAIIQWASALTQSNEFGEAIKLCDVLLERDSENSLAAKLRTRASNEEVQLVVQAMAADVGEKGHWYLCPNGHYYTIGECGGAMQVSRCPDCKARVGGGSHRLLDGNRHSSIDGSSRSAWPGG